MTPCGRVVVYIVILTVFIRSNYIFSRLRFCAPFADIQFWYQAATALEHWVAEMSSKYYCQALRLQCTALLYLFETILKASGCMVSISELSQSILARLTFSSSDI